MTNIKRKRDKQILFYLTEKEKDMLNELVHEAVKNRKITKMSRNEYMLYMLNGFYAIHISKKEKELSTEK